jgi:hypothetical protein
MYCTWLRACAQWTRSYPVSVSLLSWQQVWSCRMCRDVSWRVLSFDVVSRRPAPLSSCVVLRCCRFLSSAVVRCLLLSFSVVSVVRGRPVVFGCRSSSLCVQSLCVVSRGVAVALCRLLSSCVVCCRSLSLSVVRCRHVSFAVVLCRPVSSPPASGCVAFRGVLGFRVNSSRRRCKSVCCGRSAHHASSQSPRYFVLTSMEPLRS